ncbi:MAG: phasin family protein [Burkholderiaceae bacterium]
MATVNKTAATKSVEQMEHAVAAGKQTVEKAINATREQVEKASTATLKGYDELASLNKEQADALLAAANSLSRGIEEMGKSYAAFAQSALDSYMEAGKALLTARSLNDVVDIQTSLARSSMDAAVNESTKVSEMVMKATGEALQPLQSCFNSMVTVAMEKATKPVTL